MNKELLQRLRDQIADNPDSFDWTKWDCGTQACVAGWTCKLAGVESSIGDMLRNARSLLGLNFPLAEFLFFGSSLRSEDVTLYRNFDWRDDFGNRKSRQEMHEEALRRIDYILKFPRPGETQ